MKSAPALRSTPAQRRALYRANSLRVRSILGHSLSQRTLAKRIGLTDGGLSMMLRGRRRLTLEVAQRIARELKITLDELQKRLAKARAQ